MVYAAYQPETGKCYVGQTVDIEHRKFVHKSFAGTGRGHHSRFYNAIRKYGFETFEWLILSDVSDRGGMDRTEKLFIALLRSTDLRYGYNLTAGGGGGSVKGNISEETRKKQSRARLGKKLNLSQESREQIRKRRLGHPTFLGRTHSIETRMRMSEARKAYWLSHSPTESICKNGHPRDGRQWRLYFQHAPVKFPVMIAA